MAVVASVDDVLSLTDTPDGTLDPQWKLIDLQGWWSAAPLVTDEDDIPDADGSFPGVTFRRGRHVSLNGMVTSTSLARAKSLAWDTVNGLSGTGQAMLLSVADDDLGTRSCTVRLDSAPQVIPYSRLAATFQIPLFAPDPRKYGPPVLTTVVPSAGSGSSGLHFPLFAAGYLDFGTFSPAGGIQFTNHGTAPSYPVFTVQGSLPNGFEVISGSDVLKFTGSVPLGSQVTLSPYAGGRATQGGSDVTTSLVEASWSPVLPGETKQYTFNALGTGWDSNAALTASFSDAWW